MTSQTTFESVWDALEDTPSEAACLKARADMMMRIQQIVESWGVSQAEAARRLGVTVPRLDDLEHGRINRFTLDSLVNLAMAAGLDVAWTITPRAA